MDSFKKTAINRLISSHNSFPVLFDKIASVYFIRKIYLYFSIRNGQPREPAQCQLYRHTFIPYWDFFSFQSNHWVLWWLKGLDLGIITWLIPVEVMRKWSGDKLFNSCYTIDGTYSNSDVPLMCQLSGDARTIKQTRTGLWRLWVFHHPLTLSL